MGTIGKMFDQDMIEDMVNELKEWPAMSFGDEDIQALAVGPFLTIYFLYDSANAQQTVLTMIDLHQRFERMTNSPFAIVTDPDSERPYPIGSNKLPDPASYAKSLSPEDYFILMASSEKNARSSPVYGAKLWKMRAHMNDAPDPTGKSFSFVQFYYSWTWWLDHRQEWQDFVHSAVVALNAYVAYSGFAVANPIEPGTRADAAVLERALAPHFHGLDIDNPSGQHQLGFGIRTPTWGFFLSDVLREKLGYTSKQARDLLAHERIRVKALAGGLWIELGDKPDLYPVEHGVPELPAILNKLIKPVRDDRMSLVGCAQWEDAPNERFSKADAIRWMGRFDETSDWRDAKIRQSR